MIVHNEYELENNRGVPVFSDCPNCKRSNTFRRYVSLKTAISVANDVGECVPKKGCGYNYTPFHYSRENRVLLPPKKLQPSFIPNDIFLKSLKHNKDNNLFLFLEKNFGYNEALNTIEKYSIGTSKLCKGASVFWYIDKEGKKRTGKITGFDPETGKENHIEYGKRFVHQVVNIERFNAVKCLFGENLLNKEPEKNVVVTNSEKVAIIANCLYPEYLWLSIPEGVELPDKNMLAALDNRRVKWFSLNEFDRLKEFEI
jgi:hypothetical protein